MLSLLALALGPRPRETILLQTNALLLVAWAIYAYRDLYPLCTYTLAPADNGRLLWPYIGVLSSAAVILPAITPREYIPLDPKVLDARPSSPGVVTYCTASIRTQTDPTANKLLRHLRLCCSPSSIDWSTLDGNILIYHTTSCQACAITTEVHTSENSAGLTLSCLRASNAGILDSDSYRSSVRPFRLLLLLCCGPMARCQRHPILLVGDLHTLEGIPRFPFSDCCEQAAGIYRDPRGERHHAPLVSLISIHPFVNLSLIGDF